ncbi:MAG: hypothetical protein IKE21_09170 [Erysipelotrichaceae bacterium]|nr:hypothetical protein [Erysipelotrichaceae bacterium]
MRKGYTLTSFLLSLLCALLLLPLLVSSFKAAAVLPFHYRENGDEIALRQMRRILAVSYERECRGSELCFRYQGEEYRFYEVNQRLVLSPGTQIFLEEVEKVFFFTQEGALILHYERGKDSYERVLCAERGIHLESLPECDAGDDGGDDAASAASAELSADPD